MRFRKTMTNYDNTRYLGMLSSPLGDVSKDLDPEGLSWPLMRQQRYPGVSRGSHWEVYCRLAFLGIATGRKESALISGLVGTCPSEASIPQLHNSSCHPYFPITDCFFCLFLLRKKDVSLKGMKREAFIPEAG